MKYVISPILNDVRGLHVGQAVSIKNAVSYARMTRRPVLLPHQSMKGHPLVESISAMLTDNERRFVDFIDVSSDVGVKKAMLHLARKLSEKHGQVLSMPGSNAFPTIIYGQQFNADVATAVRTPQNLNIFSQKKQTVIKFGDNTYVTQEFANATLPMIFDSVDTFVFGGNAIGAWATKAMKLLAHQGMNGRAFNVFVHPVIMLDGEKAGIWRSTLEAEEILKKARVKNLDQKLFFSLLSLYYTTKSDRKELAMNNNGIREIAKLQNKIAYMRSWINENIPLHFTTAFFEGSANLSLANVPLYNFNKASEVVHNMSKAIHLLGKDGTPTEKMAPEMSAFSALCSLLDYDVPAADSRIYETGSELRLKSKNTSATDLDLILIPGKDGRHPEYAEQEGIRVDLKVFSQENLSRGFNHKFTTMILDSDMSKWIKDSIRRKIALLSPYLPVAYLVEGLFEGYLFELIYKEALQNGVNILPTDFIKKSAGLQRSIDSFRWYLSASKGIELLETPMVKEYNHLLERKRSLAKVMTRSQFLGVRSGRCNIMPGLRDFDRVHGDANSGAYLAILDDVQNGVYHGDFPAFSRAVFGAFDVSKLDYFNSLVNRIKFSESREEALSAYQELRGNHSCDTRFMSKEALKALLQHIRLQRLILSDNVAEPALDEVVIEDLRSIDQVYVGAAWERRLPQDIDSELLFFYWNNLSHVSDLYLSGLPDGIDLKV